MAIDSKRRDAVQEALNESGLDAVVCFLSTEVLLLTGYWPVMGLSLAVFTKEGEVGCVVPEDELEIAQATSSATLIPYKPASLEELTCPSKSLLPPLRKLFASVSLSVGQIGTDLHDTTHAASYQSTHHLRGTIESLLKAVKPNVDVVSADAMLSHLRSVKTPTEIDLIRHAAELAASGFDQARRSLRPVRREYEVAAEIEAAYAKVAQRGFERGKGYYFCMSGPNSTKASGAYARTRSRTIQEGDIVMIHANTVGDGYWTDITRSYIIGDPTSQQQRMRDAIQEARDAALNTIAPGVCAKTVDAAARDVLKRNGFGEYFKHPTGHGVGFAAADPQATPRLHPKSPDVLEAGMTFNIEPAIYMEGVGGMRHCDVVVCTSHGSQVLTEFP